MKPTQEELQLKSDNELDELSALLCMSLHLSTDIKGQPAYADSNDRLFNDNGIWQPTQNTTEGKAQCLDLMLKTGNLASAFFSGYDKDGQEVICANEIFADFNGQSLQRKVVIAAILRGE